MRVRPITIQTGEVHDAVAIGIGIFLVVVIVVDIVNQSIEIVAAVGDRGRATDRKPVARDLSSRAPPSMDSLSMNTAD